MSLTSHWDDKNNPVRQFFEVVFPDRSHLFSQIREAWLEAVQFCPPTNSRRSSELRSTIGSDTFFR